jgi:catechol 2,3-dioxygenase-like lactoylglutathione lyase family enzyme
MKVLGLRWLGSRTGHLDEMTRLFGEVLGLPVGLEQPDARVFDLPDGSAVEVFKPSDTDHSFFEHPVAGLLVDDVREVRAHMQTHGVEFIGEVHDGIETSWATAWSHFRAPDGHVYVLVSRAARPTTRAFDELRICLRVSDLDAAIALYRDGLGMNVVDEWQHPGGQRGVLFGVVPAAIEIFDDAQWDLVDNAELGRTLHRDHALRIEARDTTHLAELADRVAAAGGTRTGEVTTTPWEQTCLRMESGEGEQLSLFVLPDEERKTRTEARRHLGA